MLILVMFGGEGDVRARLFKHPLKDADLFSRGPLPGLVLSGGGMVASQR
jgi:hypothetical protein